MRRAYNQEVVYNEDENFLGFNLGADFTSEHEWGIKELLFRFGVNSSLLGVDGRSITEIPKGFVFKEIKGKNKKYCVLILLNEYWLNSYDVEKLELSNFELNFYSNDNIATAWDESTFGIAVDDKYSKEVKELYNAFLNKDILIGVRPSGVFKNGGLKFLIKSRMSDETIKSVLEADLDHISLLNAAEDTGIYKILKKAKKEYYALSPRWEDKSKKSIIFWLNPQEQNVYNFGWFTVDDLKDWAKNKGKVMIGKNK